MNKKGFTLVELIGVIVLLSIVLVVVVPSIIDAMQKTDSLMDKNMEKLLCANAETLITQQCEASGRVAGSSYSISPMCLVEEGYAKDQANIPDAILEPGKDLNTMGSEIEKLSKTQRNWFNVLRNGNFKLTFNNNKFKCEFENVPRNHLICAKTNAGAGSNCEW